MCQYSTRSAHAGWFACKSGRCSASLTATTSAAGRQIGFGDRYRKAVRVGERDAHRGEPADSVRRDRARVAGMELQSARVGAPAGAALGGQGVEINLGESAAVIVAGAEKTRRWGECRFSWESFYKAKKKWSD